MHRILIGRYIPGQSILHRLDPRSKLFFSLFFLLLIFQMDTVWDVCIIQIFLTLIIQFSGISYRFFWGNIRPFFWFAIFLALFQILMVQEGVVLFSVISWEITSKGLWLGGLLFLRFFGYAADYSFTDIDDDPDGNYTCCFKIVKTIEPISYTSGYHFFYGIIDASVYSNLFG